MRNTNLFVFCLLFANVFFAFNSSAAGTLHASNFGAIPNDGINDSDAIQQAIDNLSQAGGGTVRLAAGEYTLETPVYMKSDVILRGAGINTILNKLPSNKLAWGDTAVIMGNVTPIHLFYNEGKGFQEIEAEVLDSRTIRLSVNLNDTSPYGLKRGDIAWVAEEGGFKHVSVGEKKIERPNYVVLGVVKKIDNTDIIFEDSMRLPEGTKKVIFNYVNKQKRDINRKNISAIKNATVTQLTVQAQDESAMLMGGCYKCRVLDVNIERSVRLLSVQATRFSLFKNVTGNFTHKGIELSIMATDNVISNVQAKSIMPVMLEDRRENLVRPVLRLGESVARNKVVNAKFDLDDRYANMRLIRFDNSKLNYIKNIEIHTPKLNKNPVSFMFHDRLYEYNEKPGGGNILYLVKVISDTAMANLTGVEAVITKLSDTGDETKEMLQFDYKKVVKSEKINKTRKVIEIKSLKQKSEDEILRAI